MLRLMFVIALALLALWLVGPDRADAQCSPPIAAAAQDCAAPSATAQRAGGGSSGQWPCSE